MSFAGRASTLTVLTATALLAVSSLETRTERIAATPGDPFQDTDGDLLPDTLEWVMMTDPRSRDSNGDGVDDFLEVTQNRAPFASAGSGQFPMDHEMRSVVAAYRTPDGASHAVLHILMRIATGSASTSHSVNPFVDHNGVRIPISRLFGSGLVHVGYRLDPTEGLYIILASRIAAPAELSWLLPCAVGVTGSIGGKTFESGTVLAKISGTTAAIMPFGQNDFVFQPIDQNQDPGKPFWTSSHVCKLDLVPIGSGAGSTICQVADAGCLGVPTLRCAPSCDQLSGSIYLVPFGLGFLNGN